MDGEARSAGKPSNAKKVSELDETDGILQDFWATKRRSAAFSQLPIFVPHAYRNPGHRMSHRRVGSSGQLRVRGIGGRVLGDEHRINRVRGEFKLL